MFVSFSSVPSLQPISFFCAISTNILSYIVQVAKIASPTSICNRHPPSAMSTMSTMNVSTSIQKSPGNNENSRKPSLNEINAGLEGKRWRGSVEPGPILLNGASWRFSLGWGRFLNLQSQTK